MPSLMAPSVGPSSNVGQRFHAPSQDMRFTQHGANATRAMQEQIANISGTVLQLQATARATANDALVTDFLNRYETKAQSALNDLKSKTNLDAIDAVPQIHKMLDEEEQALSQQLQGRDSYVLRSFREKVQNSKNRFRNAADAYGIEQTISYRDSMTANQLKMAVDTVYENFGTAMEEPSRQAAREIFLRQMDEKGIDPNSDIAKALWQEQFTDAHTSRVDVALSLNQFGVATEAINLGFEKGEVSAKVRAEQLAKIYVAQEAYKEEQLRKARAAARDAEARARHAAYMAEQARKAEIARQEAAMAPYKNWNPEQERAMDMRLYNDIHDKGFFNYIKDPDERKAAEMSAAINGRKVIQRSYDLNQQRDEQVTRSLAMLASKGQGDSLWDRAVDAAKQIEAGANIDGMSADYANSVLQTALEFGTKEQINNKIDAYYLTAPVDTTDVAVTFAESYFTTNGVPIEGGSGQIDRVKIGQIMAANGYRNYDLNKVLEPLKKIASNTREQNARIAGSAAQRQGYLNSGMRIALNVVDSDLFELPEGWDEIFDFDQNGRNKERVTAARQIIDELISAELEPLLNRQGVKPEEIIAAVQNYEGSFRYKQDVADAISAYMYRWNLMTVEQRNAYEQAQINAKLGKAVSK